jgi:hypothetical protein
LRRIAEWMDFMETPQHQTSEEAIKIPQELINELHEANQKLHDKRKQMEGTLDDYNAELGIREASLDHLRDAHRQIDEVKRKIDEAVRGGESKAGDR